MTFNYLDVIEEWDQIENLNFTADHFSKMRLEIEGRRWVKKDSQFSNSSLSRWILFGGLNPFILLPTSRFVSGHVFIKSK